VARTAVLIGLPETLRRLHAQLGLLDDAPVVLGWVLADESNRDRLLESDGPVLGTWNELEVIVARRQPGLALVSLPAVLGDLVKTIRTRLRRLGVPDRFMPTLEDQLAGVGPRMQVDLDLAALIDRSARDIDETLVRSIIEGKRVLITGAGGSIGSELARLTASFKPAQITLIDRSENSLFEIDRQIARRYPELSREALLHDVVDRGGTFGHFKRLKPEIIFHAAAHKHVPMMEDHPAAAVDNNLFGTQSAAVAADAVGAERFVMISTDKAVRPTSVMGATKRLAELYVQNCSRHSNTRYAIVRFGNVLGSSGSVLDIWSRQIADGGPITITDPRMTRYFMTIPEAASLVVQAGALAEGTKAPSGRGADGGGADVFVLDMGAPIAIVDLAQRFVEQHGLTPRLVGMGEVHDRDAAARLHDSPPSAGRVVTPGSAATNASAPHGVVDIVVTGRRPGEKLHEELVSDGEETRSTAHPRISVWMVPAPDGRYIERLLWSLGPTQRPKDPGALAEMVRGLVTRKNEPAAA
jgi:FlaA1/EpsC-like NDP-sugar epimerase